MYCNFAATLCCITLLLTACTPAVEPVSMPAVAITQPQPSASSTSQPSATPLPPTMTATAASASPTAESARPLTPTVLPSPTPVPTYDTLRRTPPTLMLHKSNPNFDAVQFIKDFLPLVKARGLRGVTYQQITAQPDITAEQAGKLFIFTIDDIALQAPIDPSIQAMIDLLREAGYSAVLGIISEGKLPDPNTARQLKELAEAGWELAVHTDSHADLHELEKIAPKGTRLEIRTCSDKIYDATGVRPITVVLPYGSMVANREILTRENIRWAVGITAGERYRTTNDVYYVGREGPTPDAERTLQAMIDRFSPLK